MLIHTGVNDLDYRDGATVATTLVQVAQRMKTEHPQMKIIISEVTPRKHHKDDEVKICNEQLHARLSAIGGVTMAIHSNLRAPDWRFHRDDKHIDRTAVRKFASNLKTALRKAIGIAQRPKNTRKKVPSPRSVDDLRRKLLEVLGG